MLICTSRDAPRGSPILIELLCVGDGMWLPGYSTPPVYIAIWTLCPVRGINITTARGQHTTSSAGRRGACSTGDNAGIKFAPSEQTHHHCVQTGTVSFRVMFYLFLVIQLFLLAFDHIY